MNLETKIRIRKWCPVLLTVSIVEATLGDLVRNPVNYNMSDLGSHLVNAIREDLQLTPFDPASVAGSEELYRPVPTKRPRPPFESFKRPYCRGSMMLGSACGTCEKCEWERTVGT